MKILLLQNKTKPEPKIQAFHLLKAVFFISFLFISQTGIGQSSPFTFSGYLETYYSYDFNKPYNHIRPDFLYNFKRHNEFNINLGLFSAQYFKDNIRATVALMVGNYSQYNLADEPQWGQMIYEASAGVKISEKSWIDVGIMPSHIGFETAIGADNWHLTRSLLAENSPYFLTGVRWSHSLNDKTDFTLWLANGWQNIQRKDNQSSIAFGLRVDRKWKENLTWSYANFFSNENPYGLFQPRFFNNWILTYTPGDWGFRLGTDIGFEQSYQKILQWQGYTFSIQRSLSQKIDVAGRGEYYSDPKGVILNDGMKITGLSTNVDYHIQENALFRIEFRQFLSPEPIFTLPGAKFSIGNYALTGSLSVRF